MKIEHSITPNKLTTQIATINQTGTFMETCNDLFCGWNFFDLLFVCIVAMNNRILATDSSASLDEGIEFGTKSGYPYGMTNKQKLLAAVKKLPANASYEDAVERLVFLAKIERGLKDADAGRTISHAKLKQKMERWLK